MVLQLPRWPLLMEVVDPKIDHLPCVDSHNLSKPFKSFQETIEARCEHTEKASLELLPSGLRMVEASRLHPIGKAFTTSI